MTSTGSRSDDPCESLPDDQIMRVLASDTRRAALRALRDDPQRSLDDLATTIADDGGTSLDCPDRLRKRLHHCHLPTLDAAGLVRYDPDACAVDYLGDDGVETVLAVLGE